jgi:hypothetical protein
MDKVKAQKQVEYQYDKKARRRRVMCAHQTVDDVHSDRGYR